ncbi:hypothetical protein [Desulfitobacterium metallireducens]|nr:hypothetical protein [Desulfitobacterium metallireducens]
MKYRCVLIRSDVGEEKISLKVEPYQITSKMVRYSFVVMPQTE